jgi:hypothetical protein
MQLCEHVGCLICFRVLSGHPVKMHAMTRVKAGDVKFSRITLGENILQNILRPENFWEFSVFLSKKT